MKPSAALANLQQIAHCDCDPRTSLPQLADALRDYVAFDSALFIWTDNDDRPTGMWGTRVVESEAEMRAGQDYMTRYYNRLECDVTMSTSALLRGSRPVENCGRYGARFYESDLHRETLRPFGLHHSLRVALHDGDRPIGCLLMHRADDARAFSRTEEEHVGAARGFLSHALVKRGPDVEAPFVPGTESGQVVLDASGRILHISPEADRLLPLVFALRFTVGEIGRPWVSAARQWFEPLIRQLVRSNGATPGKGAPHIQLRNAWGGFSARAYWLRPLDADGERLISITIARQVPVPLRLLGLPAVQMLPKREKEVCILLAQGFSAPEIAARLGISPHTAIGHVVSLYRRFDVNSREQLIALLLTSH